MIEINYLSLIIAAGAAFMASFVWYIIFAKQRAKLSGVSAGQPQPLKIFGEFIKNIILALVLSYFVSSLGIGTWLSIAGLSLTLWIGFPVLILISSVTYEKVPFKLAAIHAGDWLLKLALITAIVGFWR